MPFSKTSQYAILAMTYLADQGIDRLLSIQEIGKMIQVPIPFLRKIITLLSQAKLVRSRQGPNGGVMLNRPSAEITVKAIVEAVDGPYNDRQCVLGLPECSHDNPCPLHEPWQQLKTQLVRQLHDLPLASLVQTRRRYS